MEASAKPCLNVRVVSASNIPETSDITSIDPYAVVKVSFCPNISKTRIVDNSLNPVWNYDLEFPNVEATKGFDFNVTLRSSDVFGEDFDIGSYSGSVPNLAFLDIIKMSCKIELNKNIKWKENDKETSVLLMFQKATDNLIPFLKKNERKKKEKRNIEMIGSMTCEGLFRFQNEFNNLPFNFFQRYYPGRIHDDDAHFHFRRARDDSSRKSYKFNYDGLNGNDAEQPFPTSTNKMPNSSFTNLSQISKNPLFNSDGLTPKPSHPPRNIPFLFNQDMKNKALKNSFPEQIPLLPPSRMSPAILPNPPSIPKTPANFQKQYSERYPPFDNDNDDVVEIKSFPLPSKDSTNQMKINSNPNSKDLPKNYNKISFPYPNSVNYNAQSRHPHNQNRSKALELNTSGEINHDKPVISNSFVFEAPLYSSLLIMDSGEEPIFDSYDDSLTNFEPNYDLHESSLSSSSDIESDSYNDISDSYETD